MEADKKKVSATVSQNRTNVIKFDFIYKSNKKW